VAKKLCIGKRSVYEPYWAVIVVGYPIISLGLSAHNRIRIIHIRMDIKNSSPYPHHSDSDRIGCGNYPRHFRPYRQGCSPSPEFGLRSVPRAAATGMDKLVGLSASPTAAEIARAVAPHARRRPLGRRPQLATPTLPHGGARCSRRRDASLASTTLLPWRRYLRCSSRGSAPPGAQPPCSCAAATVEARMDLGREERE
jgi:hypothetical protein